MVRRRETAAGSSLSNRSAVCAASIGKGLRSRGDLGQDALHAGLARCRVYLHTPRWTSLGLSLIEAMHLGMPVVAVASTEASRAVPPEAGFVSADVTELVDAVADLMADPELAHRMGKQAREHALASYGLDGFLRNWEVQLGRVRSGGSA